MLDLFEGGYLWAMRIAIGSDHAGFRLKEELIGHLQGNGVTVHDKGTDSDASTDYPEFAHEVAKEVTEELVDLGIVICGSGNGVSITANKHHGVRSALAWNAEVAELGRRHNNANVLALPARYISPKEAFAIVDAFLAASFEGGRHQRRVDPIEDPSLAH